MSHDLLAAIATGIFAGFCALALRHFTGRVLGWQLPRWLMPAAIAGAMIGYSIWADYSWFGRVSGPLPDQVAVISTGTDTTLLRPWTSVFPMVTRFAAVDRDGFTPVAGSPEIREGQIMLIDRAAPLRVVPVAYDCTGRARADLVGGAEIAPGGMLSGGEWHVLEPGDPGLAAICE